MGRSTVNSLLRWLGLWFLLAAIFAFSTGREALMYYRLSKHGVAAQGVARERLPHRQIGYSFDVSGRDYHGVGMTGMGAPWFEQISLGDRLPVYYLPNAPESNCLGDPEQLFSNEIGAVSMLCLLFPTMIVLLLVYKRNKKSAQSLVVQT